MLLASTILGVYALISDYYFDDKQTSFWMSIAVAGVALLLGFLQIV